MGSGGELNGVVGRVQSSGNIPGQEFFDSVDRVLADALEHVAQVRFGVDIVELRRADQAVDRGRALASGIGTAEQIVLASEGNRVFILPISGMK